MSTAPRLSNLKRPSCMVLPSLCSRKTPHFATPSIHFESTDVTLRHRQTVGVACACVRQQKLLIVLQTSPHIFTWTRNTHSTTILQKGQPTQTPATHGSHQRRQRDRTHNHRHLRSRDAIEPEDGAHGLGRELGLYQPPRLRDRRAPREHPLLPPRKQDLWGAKSV
jgi:hypothetical protein